MRLPTFLLVFLLFGAIVSRSTISDKENLITIARESSGDGDNLVSSVVVPVLETLAPSLKQLSEEVLRVRDHLNQRSPNPSYEPDGEWNHFATSNYYANTRMITSLGNIFDLQYISKEIPLVRARKDCIWQCANDQTCQAFNFYDDGTSYVCELLPDNLCINQTRAAFVKWPGSTVWDKLPRGRRESCADSDSTLTKKDSCERLRPGCLGTMPNCHSCVKTCIDCEKRYSFGDVNDCTLWPDGQDSYALPVFGRCNLDSLYFIRRKVKLNPAEIVDDFSMSAYDMSRLASLEAYSILQFVFEMSDGSKHRSKYGYKISSNGTLTLDLKEKSEGDVFRVGEYASKTMPFVTVSDDRYGCGSFWLFDASNATYCPGGEISMLGAFRTDGRQMVSTGMTCPKALRDGTRVVYTSLMLLLK